jgi:hypothetical protein
LSARAGVGTVPLARGRPPAAGGWGAVAAGDPDGSERGVSVSRPVGRHPTRKLGSRQAQPSKNLPATSLVAGSASKPGSMLNEHIEEPGDIVFRHACQLGFEGIVSKRLGSPYVSGRSRHWVKSKNPQHPAVKREAEEDWAR